MLERVVAERLDPGRLDGLELIGVDEVSFGADHTFLTCVADHQTGGIVWGPPGRNTASLARVLRRADRRADCLDGAY
jgi:transposase